MAWVGSSISVPLDVLLHRVVGWESVTMRIHAGVVWGVLTASAWGITDPAIEVTLRTSLHSKPMVEHITGSVARIGDIDGDGLDDFAVGLSIIEKTGQDPRAWKGHPVVALHSNATLVEVRRIEGMSGTTGKVAGIHDVDGDGLDDLAFGISGYGGDGGPNRVAIRSSAFGELLGEFPVEGLFLHGVTTSPRDGRRRLLIGSATNAEPYRYHGGHGGWFWLGMPAHGRVDVWSVEQDSSQVTIPGPKSFGEFVAWLDDIDGDGVDDFGVLGHAAHDEPSWVERRSRSAIAANTVEAWSGATGEPLWAVNTPWTFWAFGRILRAVGDIDQDGFTDLALGLPLHDTGCDDAGRIVLFSGLDGDILRIQDGCNAQAELGSDICALPDLDADGVADYAVGAPHLDYKLRPGERNLPGQVMLYSGQHGEPIYQITLPDIHCNDAMTLAAIPLTDDQVILAVSNTGGRGGQHDAIHFYEVRDTSRR